VIIKNEEAEQKWELIGREKPNKKGQRRLQGGGPPLMARCAGFKPNGAPCERIVRASQSFCYSHDPTRQEARRRAATKAGRAKKSSGEIPEIKRSISEVVEGVLNGTVDRSVGAVCFQGFNTLLKATEVERKIREQDILEERFEELERALEDKKATGNG